MKIYNYTYNIGSYGFGNPKIELKVDSKKYTSVIAESFLDNYTEYINRDNEPLDEAIKKIALECVKTATKGELGLEEVIEEFEEKEYYPSLDGSMGIELINIDYIDFDEDNLELEVRYE